MMRKAYRITWVTVAAVCLYLGWVYHERRSDTREFVRRLEEPKRAKDRAIVDAYGGGNLTVMTFYAVPATIRRGAKSQLCYGVSNARTVRIEPPVENVWPSFGRCVEVAPESDTVYTLVAEDAAGLKKSASTVVKVQ